VGTSGFQALPLHHHRHRRRGRGRDGGVVSAETSIQQVGASCRTLPVKPSTISFSFPFRRPIP